MFKEFVVFHIWFIAKIFFGVNLPTDDGHFGNITKLTSGGKKKNTLAQYSMGQMI